MQRRKLSPVLGRAWQHSGWDRVGVRTGLEEVGGTGLEVPGGVGTPHSTRKLSPLCLHQS